MHHLFNKEQIRNILFFTLAAVILAKANAEFYNVAWGTGAWLGEFSSIWLVLFLSFTLFCVALLTGIAAAIWKPKIFSLTAKNLISLREEIGRARWLLAFLTFIFPVYFLQYTAGGVIFQGMYMRSLIWGVVVFTFAVIITKNNILIGWNQFLAALLLTSSEFVIAVEFLDVTNYPFSLGWSEGNRLWDYSILFGRDIYLYPADKKISAFLDFGRQLIGGLPFLIPGITIGMERFWVALTLIIPYLLLGFAAFRASFKDKTTWLLAALWVFLFLKQGPIHPPLVLSAALVALAWRSPLWFAIPLTIGAGYFAETSRTTWMFAPAIWIIMLEFAGASFSEPEKIKGIWSRAIILGTAGFFGGYLLPTQIEPSIRVFFQNNTPTAAAQATHAASLSLLGKIVNLLTIQPLLWYRLLPNSTYTNGILIALVLAVAPLLIMLVYFFNKKIWRITRLQNLSLLLPSLVFLAIGLIASAKIGGGGDLHNMDMFLITLMFIGMLAWHNGAREWTQDSSAIPFTIKIIVILFFVIPALPALRELYPYNMGEEAPRLVRLADARDEKSLDMLPTQETVDIALATIREEVELAKPQGEILFIDQRQLLTFGYIKNVPFIPEYEKKVLMNEALSANSLYFAPFYKDLAAQRFALIISEPLRAPDKDSADQFGEENNDWVKYVSIPVLCFYEPKTSLTEVGVQMLTPKDKPDDCAGLLP